MDKEADRYDCLFFLHTLTGLCSNKNNAYFFLSKIFANVNQENRNLQYEKTPGICYSSKQRPFPMFLS